MPGLADRLAREAGILARLEHPGIVPVHDAGELADGRVFYVMKLVRGERLDRFAAARPLGEVLRVFLRVCEAVGFAHAQGVIHRDLKPANLMVGDFGEVLVLDWGIAKVTGTAVAERGPGAEAGIEGQAAPGGESPDVTTAAGTVLGTPGFMAPEQARGEGDLVDARSDVFGLGVVLRSLSGTPIPRPLGSVITRATAPDPDQRYASAAELAADVARFLDGVPVLAHRETVAERLGRLYLKYQTPIILVLSYLAMRLLFLAWRGR
jgi:serine/threonine-protein kinase